MTALLDALCEASLITPFDREFATTMGRIGGEERPDALAAIALASRETNEGHTCLSFEAIVQNDEWRSIASEFEVSDPSSWRSLVASSPLVARGDAGSRHEHDKSEALHDARPLVLDDEGRLYLRKYWMYQQRLAADVRARAKSTVDELDEAQLVDGLNRFFAPIAANAHAAPVDGEPQLSLGFERRVLDRQRLAAAVAVGRKFSVISGGPGTGKTATAGKILALIVEQQFAHAAEASNSSARPVRIAMVAPTGKAAATLSRSMKQVVDALRCDARVKHAIPTTALTIHRCLGVRGGALPSFRHDENNLLSVDTLLVDEASMVDLALMTRLLVAVPKHARVILLGDEYQLASVEAGAVLGDICAAASSQGYSSAFASRLEKWVGAEVDVANEDSVALDIQDSVVRLTRSYRYDEGSGIGALARAINVGDAAAALDILGSPKYPDVCRADFDRRAVSIAAFHRECVEGFGEYLSREDPEQMLRSFSHFRVLTPQRSGLGGVEELNRQIEAVLRRAELVTGSAERYAGRPLMVKVNDYAQSLWNGDIGVVIRPDGVRKQGAERGAGGERVVFDADSGSADSVRTLAFARLPECETAFAMTIHKSQGSEFDCVAVVLSEVAAERATRELLYTAITRARNRVTLFGSESAIAAAIHRKIQRSSGLADALRSPTSEG